MGKAPDWGPFSIHSAAPVSVIGMDLSDLVGRVYGPHPLRVTDDAVSAFVVATGDDPGRWEKSAPPGFIAAALFVVAPELLAQISDRSVIHGEQSFAWLRPMGIGAELAVNGTLTRARERSGVHFVTFECTVSDDEGVVAEGSSLFLVSGEVAATTAAEQPEPAHDDDGQPEGGQRSASRADLVRYAAASGDWNPVHWDHEAAVEARLPGVVVHGLLQASWAFQAACAGGSSLAAARVRFRSPLAPARPVRVIAERTGSIVNVTIRDAAAEYLSARIEVANE